MLSPKEHNTLIAEYEGLRTDLFAIFDQEKAKGPSWTPNQYKKYHVHRKAILTKMENITQKICGFLYLSPQKEPTSSVVPF